MADGIELPSFGGAWMLSSFALMVGGHLGRSSVKLSSISKSKSGDAVVGWMLELLMNSVGVAVDSMECLPKELN